MEWIVNGRADDARHRDRRGGGPGRHHARPRASSAHGRRICIGIGVSAGLLPAAVTFIKPRLGYDDSLDAFGVHGIGGIWGALATGLFASKAINAGGANGLFFGNPHAALDPVDRRWRDRWSTVASAR